MGYEAIIKIISDDQDFQYREFIVKWPDEDRNRMLETIKVLGKSLIMNSKKSQKMENIICKCVITRPDDINPEFEEITLEIPASVPKWNANQTQLMEKVE